MLRTTLQHLACIPVLSSASCIWKLFRHLHSGVVRRRIVAVTDNCLPNHPQKKIRDTAFTFRRQIAASDRHLVICLTISAGSLKQGKAASAAAAALRMLLRKTRRKRRRRRGHYGRRSRRQLNRWSLPWGTENYIQWLSSTN